MIAISALGIGAALGAPADAMARKPDPAVVIAPVEAPVPVDTDTVAATVPVGDDTADRAGPTAVEGACENGDAGCMFEAIWTARAVLPVKKQASVDALVSDLIRLADNPGAEAEWTRRGGQMTPPRVPYADFAAEKAGDVIAAEGWPAFISRAKLRQPPFNIGRPEVMAAGVRLADDPDRALALMDLMFDLARPNVSRGGGGDMFEQSDFGHVLAELSMERCDLERFDRAAQLTAAPGALRYAFWRARITGQEGRLAARVTGEASPDDTRHVRQAVQGYSAILRRGPCGS